MSFNRNFENNFKKDIELLKEKILMFLKLIIKSDRTWKECIMEKFNTILVLNLVSPG